MTEREAYINGFRKVAESYGVDPEILVKIAAGGLLSPGLQQAIQTAMTKRKGLPKGNFSWGDNTSEQRANLRAIQDASGANWSKYKRELGIA